MTWPRDDIKLERVRALMDQEDLDALVVRAPDNVLYLTNFWGMKGYDAAVFPREGEPVLITIEASEADAAETAWMDRVMLIRGYDPDDARPAFARTLDAAQEAARAYARVGLELSLGTQASDRMVGEPTTFTRAWLDAFPDALDASSLLARARAVKTGQEIERMRLANEIAAAAMEHVAAELRPGMKESEAAALWLGFVHGEGTGWKGKVELALGFSLVWSGTGIRTFTATGHRPCSTTSRPCSRSGCAPTATGATTRRTSARASSMPATTSCSTLFSASMERLSTTADPVPASRSSTC